MESVRQVPWKMIILKQESTFHLLPSAAIHIVCMVKMCWSIEFSLLPHTAYDDDNSEVFNSFTLHRFLQESILQQKWFLTRNRFREIDAWARICKRLRRPGIDSKESTPLACVAWVRQSYLTYTGPPGYIVWRNRFLGTLGFLNVYKVGLWRSI